MAVINEMSGTSTSNGMDLPFKNYGVSDIAAGLAVKLDTSNVGDTNTPQGVILTASDAGAIGFALTVLKAGGIGMVRCGGTAVAVAKASFNPGVVLMTNSEGKVLTQTSGLCQIGYAMTKPTADGDSCVVLIAPAKNA